MNCISSERLFVAVYFHKWETPYLRSELIPFDWKETMVCFGFGTLHWERNLG